MDTDATTMRRWMVAVGIFYVVLGVRLLPFVNGPMIEAMGIDAIYTGGDLEVGTPAFGLVVDWMGTFGISLLAMGGVLLVAARTPRDNRLLVHLVIWHEVGAGVLADAWYVLQGDVTTGFYLGFIVVHLVVIATGVRALRRTPAPIAVPEVAERTVIGP
jgi:hypothetical protein